MAHKCIDQETRSPRDFDHADRLNDDGTVTLRMTPSAWHVHQLSPDTYQLFNGDHWDEGQLQYLNESKLSEIFGAQYVDLDYDIQLTYDHFDWSRDHTGIVGALAEELAEWMQETLTAIGLENVTVKLLQTWSPREYNFTSDGFEVSVTCDPVRLRELSAGFDVDRWGGEHYSSYDGFASFVPSRLEEDSWHAEYDGGFRIESLLAAYDTDREWISRLMDAESEIYSEYVTVTPDVDRIRASILAEYGFMDSGHTLTELEAWGREIASWNVIPGQESTLPTEENDDV